jgi:hypothetical protein
MKNLNEKFRRRIAPADRIAAQISREGRWPGAAIALQFIFPSMKLAGSQR